MDVLTMQKYLTGYAKIWSLWGGECALSPKLIGQIQISKKNDHDHDNVDISVHWLKLVFFAFPRFHWLERLARLDRQHL